MEKHRLTRIAWEYQPREEETREDQECGGLLSRKRPWGLDHEDNDDAFIFQYDDH
jgi:hypothetical protein